MRKTKLLITTLTGFIAVLSFIIPYDIGLRNNNVQTTKLSIPDHEIASTSYDKQPLALSEDETILSFSTSDNTEIDEILDSLNETGNSITASTNDNTDSVLHTSNTDSITKEHNLKEISTNTSDSLDTVDDNSINIITTLPPETKEEVVVENPEPINKEDKEASVPASTENDTPTSEKEDKLPLIYDSTSIDYMSYVPELVISDNINTALEIDNPDISIAACSAILFNATTGEVLFYKDPVKPLFPASTAKLLTALVGLDWCSMEEEITIGNEVKMIAYDSSRANLRKGDILTVSTLLEAMLLPSGNDAAYVMANYVGRKSLQDPEATNYEAVMEFITLMNAKAIELGAENSCFLTPDGYDAIGQYTTAYDMGMIGLAAANNKTILSVTQKSSSTNTLISGRKITWNSTNSLIKKSSGWYYSNAIGLKTGTTTMAGRCLISAAREGDNIVVCVVLHSSKEGRWKDSRKLLKYGIECLK